jgi:hypothetical protein
MILAMLYCLKNKIKFVLYSKDANFGYKNGWNDFFEPFCEQTTCFIHKHLNVRWFTVVHKDGKRRLKGIFLKNLARLVRFVVPFSYFTQDLWSNFFEREMVEQEYDIPELEIKGDFVHACNQLVKLTWNYNVSTKKDIEKIMNKCILPDKYASCHVRRGDKNTEFDYISLEKYVEIIKQYNISDIYVFSDDYAVFELLQKENPEYAWHTLCDKSCKGYNHSEFNKIDVEQKRMRILELFASMEIMNKSELFIGTKTANPGTFMSIYNPEIAKGVDCDENLMKNFLLNL